MAKILERFTKTSVGASESSSLLDLVRKLNQYDLTNQQAADLILHTVLDTSKAETGEIFLCERHTEECVSLISSERKAQSFDSSAQVKELIKNYSADNDKAISILNHHGENQITAFFMRDRARGAIVLRGSSVEFAAFIKAHKVVLEAFAEVACDTFERLDIETEKNKLLEIFEELGSQQDLAEIFKSIEKTINQLFKCDGVSILEKFERSESDQILRSLYDSDPEYIGVEIPVEQGGLSWWAISNNRPLLYEGERNADGDFIVRSPDGMVAMVKPFVQGPQYEQCILICPIEYKGQLMGAIRIYNKNVGSRFDVRLDPELLSKIGVQAAIAVKNGEEFERARTQETQNEALRRIKDAINSTDDLDTVINKCLQNAVQLVCGDMGFISLRVLSSSEFKASHTFNRAKDTIPKFDLTKPDKLGIVGLVVAEEKYYLTTDLAHDPNFIRQFPGIKSKVAVPLRPPNEEIIGALSVDSQKRGAFSEHQAVILQGVADDIALFIYKTKFLNALTLLAKPFLKVDDIKILYNETLIKLTKMLGITVASILRIEEDVLIVQATTLGFEGPRSIPRNDENLSWKAITSGKTEEVYDLREEPTKLHFQEFIKKHNLISVLSVPIVLNQIPLGVINVYANRPHKFSRLEKRLAELLAETLAININNIELIQNEKQAYEELEKAYDALDKADVAVKNNNRLTSIYEMVTAFAHDARKSLQSMSPSILDLKAIINDLIHKGRIRGKEQQEAEVGLQVIISEHTNLSTYFEKLNNYGRVLETKKEMNSLNQAIDLVMELMTPRIRETKRIKVKKGYQTDFEFVFDKGQIEQVISNLVLNALQAMEKKGSTLYIGTELVRKTIRGVEKECVRIRIADDGIGIKPEDHSKIFDAFFTTKTGSGTGFGLTLCKKLVESNHEGLLDFESEWNKRTVFDVFLPYEI